MNVENKKLLALLLAVGAMTTLALIHADEDNDMIEETSEIAESSESNDSDDDSLTSENELSFDDAAEATESSEPQENTFEENSLETEFENLLPESTDYSLETVETAPAVAYDTTEYYDITTPAIQNNTITMTTQPSTTLTTQTQQQAVQPLLVSAAEQEIHNRFQGKTIDELIAATKAEAENMKSFSLALNTTLQDQANANIIPPDFTNLLQTIPAGADQAALEKEQKDIEALNSTVCLATYKDADKCKQLINADREHTRAHTQFLLDMITLTKKFKANEYTLNKATYDNAEQALKNNIAMIEKLS